MDRSDYQGLIDARLHSPHRLQEALAKRSRKDLSRWDGRLLIIAADHTARGKISLGADPVAMADRFTLLQRLTACLAMPEVDGVLGSADVLEELAWLGALEGKIVIGTMNRGGIIGASWELDDRLTSYDVYHIAEMGLDGGKSLIRIDHNDPAVARTIEHVAEWTTQLADRRLMAMLEPLPYRKTPDGLAELDPDPDALIKVVAIASGLGASSAYSWLKIPPSKRMDEVAGATSLPILMLGGEPKGDASTIYETWAQGMNHPNVRGVLAGRTLLYPQDGDPQSAVRRTSAIVRPTK